MIESRPEFASLAFSPAERYTMQELAQLANYSAARGVRLVIEVDLPGHTGYGNDISPGWCLPFPETCPKPRCQRDNDLNPAANLTYVATRSSLSKPRAVQHGCNHPVSLTTSLNLRGIINSPLEQLVSFSFNSS